MKKALLTFMVFGLIGLVAVPAWAGGPEETARERVEALAAQMQADGDIRAADIVPEAGFLYYIDLMSNASNPSSGGWTSFLVIGNWSFDVRIHLWTSFIPTGGTPSDIVTKEHYVSPNDIAYLDQFDMGFNAFGSTNWFGIVFSDSNIFYTAGVLLYHTEFGLTWITSVGPYAI